jgi:hypothetical protein
MKSVTADSTGNLRGSLLQDLVGTDSWKCLAQSRHSYNVSACKMSMLASWMVGKHQTHKHNNFPFLTKWQMQVEQVNNLKAMEHISDGTEKPSGNRNSSVRIVTGQDDQGTEVSFPAGATDLSLLWHRDQLRGPTRFLPEGYTWGSSPGVQQQGCQADHSPLSGTEAKNGGAILPHLTHGSLGGICLSPYSVPAPGWYELPVPWKQRG